MKAEELKKKVSIPYYIDYANSDANRMVGFYPNTRRVIHCYTKKQMLEQALKKQKMNNKYKITIESPLLRAGMKIETECSERYVVKVHNKIMGLVREINTPTEQALKK